MSKEHEKIRVKITRSSGWYKKGQIHEVNNYIAFGYHSGGAFFEKMTNTYGISLNDCIVLEPKKTHTIEELKEIVGYDFELI